MVKASILLLKQLFWIISPIDSSFNTSNQSNDCNLFKVIDEEKLVLSDEMEMIGDIELNEEKIQCIFCSCPEGQSHHFIRLLLIGLNEKVAIISSFITTINDIVTNTSLIDAFRGTEVPTGWLNNTQTFLEESAEYLKDKRFLFVLDLYYAGNESTEIVVNRAFKL